MKRKSMMSPESRAIVEYLRKHGPTSRKALNAAFPSEQTAVISRRLNNLSACGWVQLNRATGEWEIRPSAQGLFPDQGAPAFTSAPAPAPAPAPVPSSAAPAEPVEPVPPARYDRMRAPVWTQTLAPAALPGASDFQRVSSRGLRC